MFLHAFPTTTSLQTHLTLSDIQFRSQTETPPAKAIGAVWNTIAALSTLGAGAFWSALCTFQSGAHSQASDVFPILVPNHIGHRPYSDSPCIETVYTVRTRRDSWSRGLRVWFGSAETFQVGCAPGYVPGCCQHSRKSCVSVVLQASLYCPTTFCSSKKVLICSNICDLLEVLWLLGLLQFWFMCWRKASRFSRLVLPPGEVRTVRQTHLVLTGNAFCFLTVHDVSWVRHSFYVAFACHPFAIVVPSVCKLQIFFRIVKSHLSV